MRLEWADRFLESIAAIEVERLEPSELADGIRQLARIQDQVMFHSSRLVARFDQVKAYEGYGTTSTVAWLKQNAGLFAGAAQERVQVGRSLGRLGETAGALAQGEISFANAGVIARAASEVAPETAPELEKRAMKEARRLDPRELTNLTDRIRCELNQRDFLEDRNRAHQRRRLDLGECPDGMLHVEGTLDQESGLIVRRALELALGPRSKDDYRTPGQRRADGLVEISRTYLDGGAERQPTPVTIVAELDALSAAGGVPPAMFDGLAPIPRETLLRSLCDAAVTTVGMSASGEIAAVSRTRRTVTAKQRAAILSRYPTCAVPACDRPGRACDIHHLVAWSDGGETTIENSRPLCRYHHRLLHEGSWRLQLREDGSVELRPPEETARGPGEAAA